MEKIPKSFKVFALTVPTVWRTDLGINVGEFCSHPPIIKMSTILEGDGMPKDRACQVYCHEVVHAWFGCLGKEDLSKDEELVEQLSQCLYQFLVSREY
jgi:hypothetical protein